MKHILLYLLFLLLTQPALAQLGMGGQPHPSAALDLKATDKAFYPPRLTSAQRVAIASPQPGAMVYDTDKGRLYLHDGQNWYPLPLSPFGTSPLIDRFASDGATNNRFGFSVAMDGNYAVVGASGASSDQGKAYVFARLGNTWVEQAILTAPGGATGDYFGTSVAISGDYIVVGAYSRDVRVSSSVTNTDQGTAYVFVRSGTTWTLQTTLLNSDGAAFDNFGSSVSIAGDYILVGASDKTVGANSRQGKAYIFTRSTGPIFTTWVQQANLSASDGAATDYFGESVSIAGGYAMVGASGKDIGTNFNQGKAYIYVRAGTTWILQTSLTASDGAANDYFGVSVAIAGDYAVVGAYGKNSSAGKVYTYARSGASWVALVPLTPSDLVAADFFGYSVALSGDYLLVGAPDKDVSGNTNQGAAYLYQRSGVGWSFVRRITDDSPADTYNGAGVSISNGSFVIGGSGFQDRRGKVAFGTVDSF
ncbi:MAG: hypothetical protein EAZ91_03785 [Cytophagales bacterium]|nr:MAG: hypothetical protein EAZ91_03785 [Cytophagales bacterium]